MSWICYFWFFWSADKKEIEFVLFIPSQFLKYFLCSVGKRKFLESYEYLAVALSAWMYNCLAHITMHSEFRLTSQFWRFFYIWIPGIAWFFFLSITSVVLLQRGQVLLQTYLEGGIHWAWFSTSLPLVSLLTAVQNATIVLQQQFRIHFAQGWVTIEDASHWKIHLVFCALS